MEASKIRVRFGKFCNEAWRATVDATIESEQSRH